MTSRGFGMWRHVLIGLATAPAAWLCPAACGQSNPSILLSPAAQASGAVITHDQGIEFVTIGAAGNAPWPGNGTANDRAIGRGSVGYDYRIGRFEVTTAQWVEFFNAAFDRPRNDRLPNLIPPDHWGATSTTPTTTGGLRWGVPAGNDMIPTGSISWRMAAMYCNWLCNDKRTDRAAFLNGAYDVSTFGYLGASSILTDQLTHNPGARYWIPTWDEWLKAAHFDPNRHGAAQAGWWNYSITSDVAPVYGPPGRAVLGSPTQANSSWDGVNFPGANPFSVSLGAYPTVQSPWGLLDTAGGTSEWLEEVGLTDRLYPTSRFFDGSSWDSFGGAPVFDTVAGFGGNFPSLSTYDLGFRIASSAPEPGALSCGVLVVFAGVKRRRR